MIKKQIWTCISIKDLNPIGFNSHMCDTRKRVLCNKDKRCLATTAMSTVYWKKEDAQVEEAVECYKKCKLVDVVYTYRRSLTIIPAKPKKPVIP